MPPILEQGRRGPGREYTSGHDACKRDKGENTPKEKAALCHGMNTGLAIRSLSLNPILHLCISLSQSYLPISQRRELRL